MTLFSQVIWTRSDLPHETAVGVAVPVTRAGGPQQGEGIHQGLPPLGGSTFPRFWGRRELPIVD
jgi:hypothetical protein